MRITLSCGYSPSYRPPTMTHDDQNKPFLCQNPSEMSCHSVLIKCTKTNHIANSLLDIRVPSKVEIQSRTFKEKYLELILLITKFGHVFRNHSLKN